jgi:hypothetical protein
MKDFEAGGELDRLVILASRPERDAGRLFGFTAPD